MARIKFPLFPLGIDSYSIVEASRPSNLVLRRPHSRIYSTGFDTFCFNDRERVIYSPGLHLITHYYDEVEDYFDEAWLYFYKEFLALTVASSLPLVKGKKELDKRLTCYDFYVGIGGHLIWIIYSYDTCGSRYDQADNLILDNFDFFIDNLDVYPFGEHYKIAIDLILDCVSNRNFIYNFWDDYPYGVNYGAFKYDITFEWIVKFLNIIRKNLEKISGINVLTLERKEMMEYIYYDQYPIYDTYPYIIWFFSPAIDEFMKGILRKHKDKIPIFMISWTVEGSYGQRYFHEGIYHAWSGYTDYVVCKKFITYNDLIKEVDENDFLVGLHILHSPFYNVEFGYISYYRENGYEDYYENFDYSYYDFFPISLCFNFPNSRLWRIDLDYEGYHANYYEYVCLPIFFLNGEAGNFFRGKKFIVYDDI